MIRIVLLLTIFTILADIVAANPRTLASPRALASPNTAASPTTFASPNTAASPTAIASTTTAPSSDPEALPGIIPALMPIAPFIPIPLHFPGTQSFPSTAIELSTKIVTSSQTSRMTASSTTITKSPETTPSKTTKTPKTTPSKTTKTPKTTPSKTTKTPKTTPSKTTKTPKTTQFKTTKTPKTTPSKTTKCPKAKTLKTAEDTTLPTRWKTTKLEKFAEKLEECDFGLLDAISKDLKYIWEQMLKDANEPLTSEVHDMQVILKRILDQYHKCNERGHHSGLDIEFEIYLKIFGKEYNATEKEMRKSLFRKNKEEVDRHNELFEKGESSYKAGLNYYTDWTEEELDRMNGFRPSNTTVHSQWKRDTRFVEGLNWRHYYQAQYPLPLSTDWRMKEEYDFLVSYVTPVTNQGKCASCYAFAGIGALEAYHKKHTKVLLKLSAQNILDCTWRLGNNGCGGGTIVSVFEYSESMGVVSSSDYPYTMNASDNCQWKNEHVEATNRGYFTVEKDSELALQSALAIEGPVAAGISAKGLNKYSSGIFSSDPCDDVDRAVLVVGYGNDPMEGDYWIVKNWWGSFWGENGYVRIARNRNNRCNIASYAFFPY